MELFWYIVVLLLLILKVIFYFCWYQSRQRQSRTYIGNPRNTQLVIVGGRAYRHQTSIWPGWRGGLTVASAAESSVPFTSTAPYSQLNAPPPYETVSRVDELKPPAYSEFAHGGASGDNWINSATTPPDPRQVTEPPPPYMAHPNMAAGLPQNSGAGEDLPRAGLSSL